MVLKKQPGPVDDVPMTPLSPEVVPAPVVRRLAVKRNRGIPVQQVDVDRVPMPHVVPRQIDPVALRLMALQLENDQLREELASLRTG